MVPVLESLKEKYEGKLRVSFIDVREEREKAQEAKIELIPTQIFYDSEGKEVFRHQGFFSEEEIVKVIQEKGLIK